MLAGMVGRRSRAAVWLLRRALIVTQALPSRPQSRQRCVSSCCATCWPITAGRVVMQRLRVSSRIFILAEFVST